MVNNNGLRTIDTRHYWLNIKGVTFIEMIIAMAILVIMAGIAIPNFFDMPKYRLNGAARQVMSDLMWARMKAVSANNDYVIAFGSAGPDLSNDTYYIYDDGDNDFSSAGIEAGELVKTVVIPGEYKRIGYGYASSINKTDNTTLLSGNAVTFNSGGAAKPIWFRFRPTGLPNIMGTIYLIPDEDLANNKKDRMRAITVSIAGRVKVWRYNTGSNSWE